MRVEITQGLKLADARSSLLENHSFLNIMTVMMWELSFLARALGDMELLDDSAARLQDIVVDFSDSERALKAALNVKTCKQLLLDDIEHALQRQLDKYDQPTFDHHISNIHSILEILETRAQEIIMRAKHRSQWHPFSQSEIRATLVQSLEAIARSGENRFNVVFEPDQVTEQSYLVDFNILPAGVDTVSMPPILNDVIHDLAANSMKYAKPGGHVSIELSTNRDVLGLVIADNGRGIPDDEIMQVVEYGERARDALDKKSIGIGYRLTKAYFITKQFDGRLWIDSKINRETKITIKIPAQV